MKNRLMFVVAIIGLVSLGLGFAVSCTKASNAATPAEFYKGRTVRMIVSSEAGGGTDLVSRAVAPVLSKQLGATVKVENMDSDEGPNYVYTQGSKDGLTMVVKSTDAMISNDILKAPGTQYEADKFIYLADIKPSNKVLETSPKLNLKTLDDLRKAKGLKGGGTSAKGALATSAAVTMEILGLDGRVITGYNGKKNLIVAIAQGEIDFMVTNDEAAWKDEQDGMVVNVLTIGDTRSPAAPQAPTIAELGIKVPQQLDAVHKFISAGGTAAALPPGVPQDRVEFLRQAFMKASDDPETKNGIGRLNNGLFSPFIPGKELQDSMAVMKADKELTSQLDSIFNKYKAVN